MKTWWDKYILTAVLNPIAGLFAVYFLVVSLGMVKTITVLIDDRRGDVISDLRTFVSHMSLVVFVAVLLAGAIAIIYRLDGRRASKAPGDDESFLQKVQRILMDPFAVFEGGIYTVAVLGLLTGILVMIEFAGVRPTTIWLEWALQLFYTLAAVLILIAVRAILHSIGSKDEAAVGSLKDAAASASSDSEGLDDAANDGPAKPTRVEGWLSYISTWQQQLYWGVIALAYLGGLMLSLEMWTARDNFPTNIWTRFFYDIAGIIGTMGVIVLLTRLAEIASGKANTFSMAGSHGVADRVSRVLSDPGRVVLPVLLIIAVAGSAWALIIIWSGRNAPVDYFWSQVMSTLFLLVAAISLPLVLWSLWKGLFEPNAVRTGPPFLYDTPRLLKILIVLMVYMGLIEFVLDMWIFRDSNPASIWALGMSDLFNIAVRVGLLVAVRAILISVAAARSETVAEPVMAADTVPVPGSEPSPEIYG